MKCKLQEMFTMQEKLNDDIFFRQRILNPRTQLPLCTNELFNLAQGDKIGPSSLTNEWLKKLLWALNDESRELQDELLEKWWSKDHLDMQNIRVEIIDQLHFWISLALTAGMDAQKVYDIYLQKNKVNLERQEKGYNKASKTEEDNKGIS